MKKTILAICVCLCTASIQAQSYTFNMVSDATHTVVGTLSAYAGHTTAPFPFQGTLHLTGGGTFGVYSRFGGGSLSVSDAGVANFDFDGVYLFDDYSSNPIRYDVNLFIGAHGDSFGLGGFTDIGGVYTQYQDSGKLVNIAPPVPEPETYALLLGGLALLAAASQLRSRRHSVDECALPS